MASHPLLDLVRSGHARHAKAFPHLDADVMAELDRAAAARKADDRDPMLRSPQHDVELKYGELLGRKQKAADLTKRADALAKGELKFVKRRREVVARCLGALAEAFARARDLAKAEDTFEEAIDQLVESSGSSGNPMLVSAELVERIGRTELDPARKRTLIAHALEQYPGPKSRLEYARAVAGWAHALEWERGLEAARALDAPQRTAESLVTLARLARTRAPDRVLWALDQAQPLLDEARSANDYERDAWEGLRLRAAWLRAEAGQPKPALRELERALQHFAKPREDDDLGERERLSGLGRIANTVATGAWSVDERLAVLDAAWAAVGPKAPANMYMSAAMPIAWARHALAPKAPATRAMVQRLEELTRDHAEAPVLWFNAHVEVLSLLRDEQER